MSSPLKLCVDWELPSLTDHLPPTANFVPLELAVDVTKFWKPGRAIHIRFLDGDLELQKRVEEVAHTWSKHANIEFVFDNQSQADIRITFEGQGSASLLGISALDSRIQSNPNAPTMRFGWLDKDSGEEDLARVVLHEFGHALGCIHEHQNPEHKIPWNREAVMRYYMGTQGWTRQQVIRNVLDKYNHKISQYTEFDPESIMLYPIPNELTVGDWAIEWRNHKLSPTDIDFIGQIYPFETSFTPLNAALLWVDRKVYFFKGAEYICYIPDGGVEPGYPKPISAGWTDWPPHFTSGIDAAFLGMNGKGYFFKGDQYIRYTPTQGIDPGFPRRISEGWGNWPAEFSTGIDAAASTSRSKYYFFKNDLFLRYTPGAGVDPGYPKPIVAHWAGWPENLNAAIDAALGWDDNTLYFFINDEYIRYTLGKGVDTGFPKFAIPHWPGIDF